MDIATFLKNQAEKFDRGYKAVLDRKKAWVEFEKMASNRMGSISKEAPTQRLFEFLYVESTKSAATKHNFLTFFFGQHPIGYDYTSQNSTNKIAVEGGCAVHYSQGPRGEVACIIYPFSSELMKPKDEYFIYTIYKSPACISEKDVYHHVKLLFAVAHHSSCFGQMSFLDWLLMLEIRLNILWNKLWRRDPLDHVFSALEKAIDMLAEKLGPSKDA